MGNVGWGYRFGNSEFRVYRWARRQKDGVRDFDNGDLGRFFEVLDSVRNRDCYLTNVRFPARKYSRKGQHDRNTHHLHA